MAHLIYLNSYEMNLSDLSHSQICQRVRSVICEAVWEAVRVRSDLRVRSVRPIGLSRTPGDAVILGPVWLISRLNALHRPLCVRGRSASQIGLSNLWGRARTPTASHHKVMWSVWESEVRGRSASHAQRAMQSDPRLNALLRPVEVRLRVRSERPIAHGLSRTPIGLRAMQSDPRGRLTDFTAKRIASPGVRSVCVRGRVRERPCSLLIGSDRSHDKFCEAEGMRGRKWEAVRGRERPCSSHWLRDLCQRVPDLLEPIRGARPLTASHGLSRPHRNTLKMVKFPNFR